jgi:hypothetical protein
LYSAVTGVARAAKRTMAIAKRKGDSRVPPLLLEATRERRGQQAAAGLARNGPLPPLLLDVAIMFVL